MQVVNRKELLDTLEDIANALDMKVRPYSATSSKHTYGHVHLCP